MCGRPLISALTLWSFPVKRKGRKQMFAAIDARPRTVQRRHDMAAELQDKQLQPLMLWYDYCTSQAEPIKNNLLVSAKTIGR